MQVEVGGKIVELPDDYDPRTANDEYMCDKHRAYFKVILQKWLEETQKKLNAEIQVEDIDRRSNDESDAMSIEVDTLQELRKKDRLRKLAIKIEENIHKIDMDTYGKTCTNAEVGTRTNGVVTETNKYYCTANGWVSLMSWNWDVPKEAHFNPNITYGSMTDERDGKVYRTVQIGDQIWMAENLNYADSVKTPSLLERSWCYDNKTENCDVAGRLYTWAAAIDSVALYDNGNGVNCGDGVNCTMPKKVRGICPSGWHLPRYATIDDDEFRINEFLILYNAAGEETSGKALKSQIGWEYVGNEYIGTDTLGFSGIPAGYRTGWTSSGLFTAAGGQAYFHTTITSADFSHHTTIAVNLSYGSNGIFKQRLNKSDAYSVRCIKDSE